MTPQSEQTILNIFGLLLMVAYIIGALLMNRAPNAPPEVEAMQPERDYVLRWDESGIEEGDRY